MASKEFELTPNVYIFAGVGALILGTLGAFAFSGSIPTIISAGVVGALAGGSLGLFF
ncbi:MAG TPA: hypothetical protein VK446_00755 [Methylocystis sp.]|nr:hypothetical protein [Methylocystis sp.]